ncbi:hypothetical protein Bbelb_115620 [Branchiostoma belcheri]|nr:hypothetical protein Bbelb_115620 [Branchiostoma belcheri]
MYEQADQVETSTLGSGHVNSQSSAPPSQAPPVNQGGPSGRDSRGDDGSEESPEEVEASANPYEEAERVYYTINPADLSASVNGTRQLQSSIESESPPAGDGAEDTRRYVMDTSAADNAYPAGASGCSFLRARRSCMVATLATLAIVGFALTMFVTKEEMSRLSTTVDVLKSNLDKENDRIAALEQRLHEMGKAPGKSETVTSAGVSGPPGPTGTSTQGPMGTVGPPVPTEMSSFPSTTGPPEHQQTSAQSFMSTAAAGSCPREYTEFRGICYKTYKRPKSYKNAAAACREDGGTLAMPKDADINDYLISLIKPKDPRSGYSLFWFGLHDQRREGRFEWVDGTPLGEFNSWGEGQPDDFAGEEDCVIWWTNSHDFHMGWSDYDCHRELSFMCQVIPGISL